MVIFRDQLFTFFGSCNTHRYDPAFDAWSSLKHLHLKSFSRQVAVIRGQIYAIDVEDERQNKSTIERYNIESWSWESVIAAGDCLYVLGGKTKSQKRNRYHGFR